MQRQLEKLAILVVEDEPIIALDLQYLLEAAGAGPVVLEHGLEGARRQIAGGDLPDVVILDLILRGSSSLPLAAELKERSIPFLFLTGDAISIPPGFADIRAVEKPFDADQLVTTVCAVALKDRAAIRSNRPAG